jgi:hypothetical protein
MKRSILPVALLAMIIVGGCGDPGSEETGSKSPIVGTWLRVQSETRVGTDAWAEDKDSACLSDDTEVYGADGTFEAHSGTMRCSAGTTTDTGVIRGTWRLTANDTKIIYTYQGFKGEYDATLESLDATQMIRSWSTLDTAGTQMRVTFEKQ